MLSGRRLNLLDPSPLDVEIRDIAHGLARVARWNGQTIGPYPYSVAQHSLAVEAIFNALSAAPDPTDQLAVLLHDAPEYVVGDLISPFKAAIGDAYRNVEERLMRAIELRFSIPADRSGERTRLTKVADRIAAHHEATALAGFSSDEANALFGAPAIDHAGLADMLTPWSTLDAEERFLARFEALDAAARLRR